ncbi:hypothetical protein LXL04_001204 [Taraxacum kok-saghyz]
MKSFNSSGKSSRHKGKEPKRARVDTDTPETDSPQPTPIRMDIPAENTHGIVFVNDNQIRHYQNIFKQHFYHTKFVPRGVLRELHMQNEVKRIFKNIGWEKLLTLQPREGYLRPTLEFLSCLSLGPSDAYIDFRMYNTPHRVSLDTICSIVHTPLRGMLTCHYDPRGFEASEFWLQISNDTQHRAGVATKGHLQLLYLMTHDDPPVLPHFGSRLVKNLLKAQSGRTTENHYGGLVTLVLDAAGIQISRDAEIKSDDDFLLTSSVLAHMSLFNPIDGGQIWQLQAGGRTVQPHILVNADTQSILKLPRQLSGMLWRLPSNINNSGEAGPSSQVVHYQPHPSTSRHSPLLDSPPHSQGRHSSATLPSYFTDFQAKQNRRWYDLDSYHQQREDVQRQQQQQIEQLT